MRLCLALMLLFGRSLAQDSSTSSSSSSSGTCEASAPLQTLASASVCDPYCGSYEPCVVLNSAGLACGSDGSALGDASACAVNAACAVACVEYSSLAFTVYVPFGAFQSEEEQAARAIDNSSYEFDIETYTTTVTGYFYLNDDRLDSVGTLELNPYTSRVTIAGGDNEYLSHKSKVANVTLAGAFLADQSQVTAVKLLSLNLKEQADELVQLLPATIDDLTLTNDLLYDFPWTLVDALPALTSLTVQENYISTVEAASASSYPLITYLVLSDNGITTFSGSFPSVETLYLDGNNLTEFPAAINDMPLLTLLDLSDNQIATIDASVGSESVTSLTLSYNQLTSFEGSFPNLESLYISNNLLTAIPNMVYDCPKLTYLSISSNPLTLNLTTAQLEFLRQVESVTIYTSDLVNVTYDCTMDQLDGIAVCITDANETPTVTVEADDEGSNTGAIIGGVVGGLVALALLVAAIAFFLYRKRNSGDNSKDYQSASTPAAGTTATDSNDVTATNMSTTSSSTLLASDPRLLPLQLNPRDVQDIRMIGEGTTSIYWLVRYRRDTLLASKRLRVDEARRDDVAAFVREILLVATLEHPAVVKLVGITWRSGEKQEPAQVAQSLQALFEFVDNGTLHEYLLNPGVPRSWHAEKLDVAVDVADALVYLHSLSPPVLHRDVRSPNVLLTSDMHGKLASFGSARAGDSADGIGNLVSFHGASFGGSGRGQIDVDGGASAARWVAPEVLASAADHGEAADVYSFGVLMLELDSHGLPFDDAFAHAKGPAKAPDEREVLRRIVAGELQPSFGFKCPPAVVTLGLACLDRNPWNRPRASDVAYKLRQARKALGTAV